MLEVVCGTEKSLPSIPRSKGCLNCTSRRKRCDGRRPTCKTCEDRMEACRGYRRSEFTFLNEGWRTLGVANVGRKKRKVAKQIAGVYTSPSPESAPPSVVLQRDLGIDRTLLYTTFFLSEFATYLLPSPHVIAGLFSSYFVFLNSLSPEATNRGLTTPVIFAVDALAQGHFGKAKSDASLMQQSCKKYGRALRSMKSKIEELKLDDTGFRELPEDEWQNLAFFCLVMAFWELRMAPASQSWQTHIRALSDAIALRGPDHAYSQSNIELIATSRLLITLQSLSSRQPGRLSSDDEWQGCFSIPASWIEPIKCSERDIKNPMLKQTCEDHSSAVLLESVMSHIASTVSVMAEYDQLAIHFSNGRIPRDKSINTRLINLYNASEQVLKQTQASFAQWEIMLSHDIPREECLFDPPSDEPTHFWWKNQLWPTFSDAVGSLFDTCTFLSFRSFKACHAVSLFRTTVMSLHLLVLDILGLMIQENLAGQPEKPHEAMQHHRKQLVCHATSVIRAIPCIGQLEKTKNAPFFLATSFQVTILVLDRECTVLKEEEVYGYQVMRLESMRELAARYLDWLEWTRIAITVNGKCFHRGFLLNQFA